MMQYYVYSDCDSVSFIVDKTFHNKSFLCMDAFLNIFE